MREFYVHLRNPTGSDIVEDRAVFYRKRAELLRRVAQETGCEFDSQRPIQPPQPGSVPKPYKRQDRPFGHELEELAETYYFHDGTRKSLSYFAEYDRILRPLRYQPIRLLELGVSSAASMLVFRDYLPNATIVGLDGGEKPARFPKEARVKFVQSLQDDPSGLRRCIEAAGGPLALHH